ncbi:signal transduction histidine kinase [Friedmanniella endophytica]|uniref:histidine kinase n=1 Tax=Microlunatus kandeliicorticis TaxID=1759536 RepID=A0A7W3P485_9ACTN|nr:ATP-binding protein [Microlunatus kandeliicorticis]MBA8792598.1 signal transduction histidine kinase [Microlunatus kandeliicorticis]
MDGSSDRTLGPLLSTAVLDMVHRLTGFPTAYLVAVDAGQDRREVLVASTRHAADAQPGPRPDLEPGDARRWQGSLEQQAVDAGIWATADVGRELGGSRTPVRSLVAVPVYGPDTGPDAAPVAVLCAADPASREVPDAVRTALTALTQLVADQWRVDRDHADQLERLVQAESRSTEQSLRLSEDEHKLKTPLAVVNGWTELLVGDWDDLTPEHRDRAVRTVLRAVATARDQASQLLADARRGDAGPLSDQLASAPLDLSALLERLAGQLDGVRTSGQRLRTAIEPGLWVLGDRDAVWQLVWHLAENAVKYSPGGGTITLAGRRTDVGTGPGEIEVTVDDEGIGVPVDVDVFTPFVRGAGVGAIKGTGLGLHIVRRLVTASGGTVTAARRPTGGSRFTVRLPSIDPSDDQAEPASEWESESESGAESGSEDAGSARHVPDGVVLPSAEPRVDVPPAPTASARPGQPRDWRRVDPAVLDLVHELTGLDTTYISELAPPDDLVMVEAEARGAIELTAGEVVSWPDSVCRSALDRGIWATTDAQHDLPDSPVARSMDLRTYVGVPIVAADQQVVGTLCGIGREAVTVPPTVRPVLLVLAQLVAEQWDRGRLRDGELGQAAAAAVRLREHAWRLEGAARRLLAALDTVERELQRLLVPVDPDERRRVLGLVAGAARAAVVQVERLLDAGRSGSRAPAPVAAPFALEPLIATAADDLAAVSGRPVDRDLTPGLVVTGDPDAVRQALWHLTDNAVRYSPEGSAIELVLAADPGGRWARIVVGDRGPGLDPAIDAFAPVVRASQAQTSGETTVGTAGPARSAGLGLHIVRTLVGALGGTVAVHPRPGGGSRFTIALPLTASDPASDPTTPVA